MVRKKIGLLTTGLSSELFLLAYLEPNNIRQLAQKLQNTSGNPTNYSKASPAIHDLTIEKYLKHSDIDEKYHVNISKLTKEIELIFQSKNIVLDDEDKKYLKKLLEENAFFKLLSQDVVVKIQSQEKGKHEINALDVICECVGAMSSTMLIQKRLDLHGANDVMNSNLSFEENVEEIEDLKSFWNENIGNLDEKIEEHFGEVAQQPLFQQFLLPVFKNLFSIVVIFIIPEKTLEKFIKLWSSSDGIILALQLISQLKK